MNIRNNSIVEKIHNSFYSEMDKLLIESNILIPEDNIELIEKSKRLEKLGFTNSKEVKILKDFKNISKNTKEKLELQSTILYFLKKYPNYKFITTESIQRLCKEYNLYFDSIEKYQGEIPEKNLRDIENFKVSDDDSTFIFKLRCTEFLYHNKIDIESFFSDRSLLFDDCIKKGFFIKRNLSIVAPSEDFNIKKDKVVNGFEDPIVFYPICKNNKIYYFIITAWGGEENII